MRWRAVWAATLLVVLTPAAAARAHGDADRAPAPVFGPLPPTTWSAVEQLRWRPTSVPDPDVLEAGHAEALRNALAAGPAKLGEGPDGGPGVAHHAGARPAPDPVYQVPSGVQHSVGVPGFEPSMGITSDGDLFYLGLSPTAAAGSAVVMRSTNEGQSWTMLKRGLPTDSSWPTNDPLVYVDPKTNRLFDIEFNLPCYTIFISDDRGETFRTTVSCNLADHQTLFAGPPPAGGAKPNGYPNVLYYCAIDAGASVASLATSCAKSMDGGTVWLRTLTPAYLTDFSRGGGSLGVPGLCYGATGHGRVGPDGTIYLPRGFCDQPFLAISHDEGDTWTRVQVSDKGMLTGTDGQMGLEEHEARVAIDPAGNVYYFWVAVDRLPYLAISRDGGQHFGKAMMVAPPGVNEAWGPAIAAGDTGRIAFSYLATTNSPGPPYCTTTTLTSCKTADGSPPKPASGYAKTSWNGYLTETVDALSQDPTFYTATVNAPSDPYTRGACSPIACEPTHEFHDVQIAPDGTPWTTFADGCTSDPAQACSGSMGVVGRLVGGPTLRGTLADQRPRIASRVACVARSRPLKVVVRPPRRAGLRSVRVTVGGRRVAARRRGRSFVARVNLRRYAAGRRVVVRIVSRTSAGRRYATVRRYRVCG